MTLVPTVETQSPLLFTPLKSIDELSLFFIHNRWHASTVLRYLRNIVGDVLHSKTQLEISDNTALRT